MESVYARVQNIYHGEITLHLAQIVNTEQLQHYIPYKHGFRYIIVNTLHKGDNKYDDDDYYITHLVKYTPKIFPGLKNYIHMLFIESYFDNTHKYNKGNFLKVPVISPPPSSAGGFHASDTLSCVVLVYDSGPFGIPGLSTTMTSISAESLPYSFFAVMVYFPESCLVEESIRKLVLSLVVCACTHSQERHCLPSHMLCNCLTALCLTISP